MSKKLIPRLQTAWSPIVAQSDNTRVQKPIISRPIKYTLQPGESYINVRGQRILAKPNQAEVQSDNRSQYQVKQDQKRSETLKKKHEKQKKEEEAMKTLGALGTMISPSTYIGPIFNDNGKSYIDNMMLGVGTGSTAGNVAIDILTPFAISKGLTTLNKMTNFGKSVYYSNNPSGQYLRFIGGKFKYGFDARLPDLIRRTERPMLKVSIMKRNSPIRVSPIENRFRFENTGEPSPVITNFTTDLPVIPNNGGSWEGFNINIIKGNQLLGKNVISTRPMDTFTYGDKVIVPRRDITIIPSVNKNGIVSEQELMKKFFENYKRPTLKDYKFMDYVFRPKYSSEVIPKTELTFKNASTHPLGKYLSDGDMRSRIDQPFENVMYDIAPTIESEFRDNLGIVLRSQLK